MSNAKNYAETKAIRLNALEAEAIEHLKQCRTWLYRYRQSCESNRDGRNARKARSAERAAAEALWILTETS